MLAKEICRHKLVVSERDDNVEELDRAHDNDVILHVYLQIYDSAGDYDWRIESMVAAKSSTINVSAEAAIAYAWHTSIQLGTINWPGQCTQNMFSWSSRRTLALTQSIDTIQSNAFRHMQA